jgi:phosphoglycolate phosphatase-like HAD superfamily hydrolase
MNCFLDFDGTLIDVSDKYYKVYHTFINIHHGLALDKETYWNLKRKNTSNDNLCSLSNISPEFGVKLKAYTAEVIETEEFLSEDNMIDGVANYLKYLRIEMGAQLILITMRKNKTNLYSQLERLEIGSDFDKIILPALTDASNTDLPKHHAIASLKLNHTQSFIAGDSGMDIKAGKALEIQTFAVLSGIRNYEVLQKYNPDFIVNTLPEISKILN